MSEGLRICAIRPVCVCVCEGLEVLKGLGYVSERACIVTGFGTSIRRLGIWVNIGLRKSVKGYQ